MIQKDIKYYRHHFSQKTKLVSVRIIKVNLMLAAAVVLLSPAILPVYILIGRDFDIGFDISKGPGSRI